jgi:pimeloyl-ACP methyl ester carboxylesterase
MKTLQTLLFILLLAGITTKSSGQPPLLTFKDSLLYQLAQFNMESLNTPESGPCDFLAKKRVNISREGGELPTLPANNNFDPRTFHQGEEDINVYWIHGLGGSTESWRVAAESSQYGSLDGSFAARRLVSVRGAGYIGTPGQPAYGENNGITYASYDWNAIAGALPAGTGTNPPHSDRDFIIAHSQGGIVAREWLRNMDKRKNEFGNYAHGLVTFGTPHAGAMILNNTRPELLNKTPAFFNTGCNALGGALVHNKVNGNLLTSLVASAIINNVVGPACNALSNTIIPFALDNYHKPTTLDYYVGSPFLTGTNGLSNYTLKVPVVQFYGVEEQPIMWRFFSSTLRLGTDALSNAQAEYGYDQDDQLQDKVSNMIVDFTAKKALADADYNYWNNKSCFFNLNPFCEGQRFLGMLTSFTTMLDYDKAIKWLSEANDYYLTDIVGAKETVQEKYCLEETIKNCVEQVPSRNGGGTLTRVTQIVTASNEYQVNAWDNCPPYQETTLSPNCKQKLVVTTVYKNITRYKPNDGVVLAESAYSPILVDPDLTHTYVKLNAMNHDQMKNSAPTKYALIDLYNGGYGNFFEVDYRP